MIQILKDGGLIFGHDYKSFKKGEELRFAGDLVVVTGENGAGKSQLIEFISLSEEDTLLRSFKDQINTISQANPGYYNSRIQSIYNIMYNAQNKHQQAQSNGFLNAYLKIERKFGADHPGKNVTEVFDLSGFAKYLSENSLEIYSDHVFDPKLIGDIFLDYLYRKQDLESKYYREGESQSDHNIEKEIGSPPWKQMNYIFRKMNMPYSFLNNYELKNGTILDIKLLDLNGEVLDVKDLSDGERAIFSLAMSAVSCLSRPVQGLLLDEYDATFNPSLTEVFYEILHEFFLKNGLKVILTTHNPITATFAPTQLEDRNGKKLETKFYEMFRAGSSERIVERKDLKEIKEVKKVLEIFYPQIGSIIELQNKLKNFETPVLAVEDKYVQLYKIAFLKIYGDTKIDHKNLEKQFEENSPFIIWGMGDASSVAGLLRAKQKDVYCGKRIIGLFDYDAEGLQYFRSLKGDHFWSSEYKGKLQEGYFRERVDTDVKSMVLPIPKRLANVLSNNPDEMNGSVEIENLLEHSYLLENNVIREKSKFGENISYEFTGTKSKFWKKLVTAEKEVFIDFVPLFVQIRKLLKIN